MYSRGRPDDDAKLADGRAEVMINERGRRGKPTCGNYRAPRQRRHHIRHYRDRKSSPTTCRAGRSTVPATLRAIAVIVMQTVQYSLGGSS